MLGQDTVMTVLLFHRIFLLALPFTVRNMHLRTLSHTSRATGTGECIIFLNMYRVTLLIAGRFTELAPIYNLTTPAPQH